MRVAVVLLLAFATMSSGLRMSPRIARKFTTKLTKLRVTPSSKNDLVPLEKSNIENAAAATGGIVGFAIGGPVFALILAALSNYVSKKEDSDYGVALRGFGKTVIESYNFLTTLNNKYDATGVISDNLGKFRTAAEIESEGFGKFTKTVDSIGSKVVELSTEFDLVGKGKQAIIAASTITDAALEKLEELNSKYDFVETTKKAASSAIGKVKDQTSKSKM